MSAAGYRAAFLHTLIKYAAGCACLAGRVADEGLKAIKKRFTAAALAALSWFDKAGTPEYIEIYSDDEDAF